MLKIESVLWTIFLLCSGCEGANGGDCEECEECDEHTWPSLSDWAVDERCLEVSQTLEANDTVRGRPLDHYRSLAATEGEVPLGGDAYNLTVVPSVATGEFRGVVTWRFWVDCADLPDQGILEALIDVGGRARPLRRDLLMLAEPVGSDVTGS